MKALEEIGPGGTQLLVREPREKHGGASAPKRSRGDTELIRQPLGGRSLRRNPAPPRQQVAPGAYEFRQVVQSASQALQAVPGAHADHLRQELELAMNRRRQFWIATCSEVSKMRIISPQVLDLNARHGGRFFAPTTQQAQHVLDALDAALTHWDRDHPQLFYQTLELNFPELLRLRKLHHPGL